MTQGPFVEALKALVDALDELGAPAAIIGGLAVIARGIPRSTVDIDATVSARAVEPERLAAVLARHDIHERTDDAVAFARRRPAALDRLLEKTRLA